MAISNDRIIKVSDSGVTFKWRDYKNKNNDKKMTLDGSEFIRRFLLHVLPEGFMKIRHYGLLSNRNRYTKLKKCKEQLQIQGDDMQVEEKNWHNMLLEITGINPSFCPKCKNGQMQIRKTLWPMHYYPQAP